MSDTLCLDGLTTFVARMRSDQQRWFAPDRPLYVARAPGRLDVMGGIADYTGALVLEATLGCALFVAAQSRDDMTVRIHSPDHAACHITECVWPLSALYESNGTLAPPAQFAAHFDETGCPWAKYVAGVFYTLLEAGRCDHFGGGATVVINSSVPSGAGVSSSAALEVAACLAVADMLGATLAPLDAARICQRAENLIVGAPCGIMDQVACLLGEPNTLLQLKCQPHEVVGTLALPPGIDLIGIDSGVRHSVSSDRYVDTRVAAFMGHRMIREILRPAGRGSDDPTGGYLANLTPNEYVRHFRDRLPTKVRGLRFLERFGDTADPFTEVRPDKTYKVRSRTEHHIYENARAHRFAERLARARRTGQRDPLTEAGQLMYASHWSYGQRCGLSCIETDRLVNGLRQEGERAGILGAKITGGGSGGTVAVLMEDTPDAHEAVRRATDAYREKTGRPTQIFAGSLPGAHHFGVQRID